MAVSPVQRSNGVDGVNGVTASCTPNTACQLRSWGAPIPAGEPVYENLHAAGATLAGAVPWREGSGNGLSLASGYAAASAILEAAP